MDKISQGIRLYPFIIEEFINGIEGMNDCL